MRFVLFIFLILLAGFNCLLAQADAASDNSSKLKQVYKRSNYSPTYTEIIDFYTQLSKKYKQTSLKEYGETDIGKPLHLFCIRNENAKLKKEHKIRMLVNNGIHAGEPDGINASMQLADEILQNWKSWSKLFDTVELYIIPVYNVDGCLRRDKYHRANQNGPVEQGFRGNYQNLDLNRDFIKMDSKNAFAFAKIFHKVNPHILADTHVSNGADYQYTFTYFFSQPDKLPQKMAALSRTMENQFKQAMINQGTELVPYVNHHDNTALTAMTAFYDSPRYCTGYASLFNCIAITTETHMLKPFDNRVKTTYQALKTLLHLGKTNYKDLLVSKTDKTWFYDDPKKLPVNYVNDTTVFETIAFKGFKSYKAISKVTGLEQVYYDEKTPVETTVKYYNKYNSNTILNIPNYYLIPQSWDKVIERLKANKVLMKRLKNDTTISVECNQLSTTNLSGSLYEGHYYHKFTHCHKKTVTRKFYAGDYLIKTGGLDTRFLVETLDPESVDSYFKWNLLDACLSQKEWFSDYVFDPMAEELLAQDPELKRKLEEEKQKNPEWAKDPFNQLYFIYKNSQFYEQTAYEIPVYRIF